MKCGGMTVFVNPEVTDDFEKIPRTWRERLFTRPWRPWQRYRLEILPPKYYVDSIAKVIHTSARGYADIKSAMELLGNVNG